MVSFPSLSFSLSLSPSPSLPHSHSSLISLAEFRAFESLLTSPDSIQQLAFKLFDQDNKGRVTFGMGRREGGGEREGGREGGGERRRDREREGLKEEGGSDTVAPMPFLTFSLFLPPSLPPSLPSSLPPLPSHQPISAVCSLPLPSTKPLHSTSTLLSPNSTLGRTRITTSTTSSSHNSFRSSADGERGIEG